MTRLILFIGSAFLTFITGVAVSWVFTGVSSMFHPNVASTVAVKSSTKGNLEVSYLLLDDDGYGTYALFEVANGGSETAYYIGYGENSHCSQLVRQGGTINLASHCTCGTGLAEQALKQGDSVILSVRIPNPNDAFEVGFDFSFGENRQKKTIWSRRIEPWTATTVEQ